MRPRPSAKRSTSAGWPRLEATSTSTTGGVEVSCFSDSTVLNAGVRATMLPAFGASTASMNRATTRSSEPRSISTDVGALVAMCTTAHPVPLAIPTDSTATLAGTSREATDAATQRKRTSGTAAATEMGSHDLCRVCIVSTSHSAYIAASVRRYVLCCDDSCDRRLL